VFLPTYSSWLNWIEPEFATLRYFALGGTDHRTHAWQGEMIDRYICWHAAAGVARPASARADGAGDALERRRRPGTVPGTADLGSSFR
jgi:hypothetical protein